MNINLKNKTINNFLISELELNSPNIPKTFDNFTIVQLSDLHYGSLTSADKILAALETANSLKPDLVLLTGDFIQQDGIGLYYKFAERSPRLWRKYRLGTRKLANELLAMIAAQSNFAHIIGCFGNHDHHEGIGTVKRILGKRVSFLKNQSLAFEKDGAQIAFYGIDDFKFGKPKIKETFDANNDIGKIKIKDPFFKIMLSHNPDTVTLKNRELLEQIDLILCGHTHGGQIRFPLIGALRTGTKQKMHVRGLSQHGKTKIYVNNGIGYSLMPIRLRSPAEITVVRLTTSCVPSPQFAR